MTVTLLDSLLRLGVGLVLGAVIGFEREHHDRPAGLRTHLLVALASTLAMLVSSQFMFYQGYGSGELVRADASRIAAGVLMGIGFIGGGAILRDGLNVYGLTTAASIWLVAAIGLAAGAGMYVLAVTATAAALFCLVVLRLAESRHKQQLKRKIVVELRDGGATRREVLQTVSQRGVALHDTEYHHDLTAGTTKYTFEVELPDEEVRALLLARLEALAGVSRVEMGRPQ